MDAGQDEGLLLQPLGDGTFEVVHAGPAILLLPEVLRTLNSDIHGRPFTNDMLRPGLLLQINGTNRRVVYRVRRWWPEYNAYDAVWPD